MLDGLSAREVVRLLVQDVEHRLNSSDEILDLYLNPLELHGIHRRVPYCGRSVRLIVYQIGCEVLDLADVVEDGDFTLCQVD